jgi:tetratricopeptide (TPR) repeat protein
LRGPARHGEAVEAMRLAASLEPNNAQILHDLGLNCMQAGLLREAAAAFRRAVHIKPNFAHAFWRLGVALQECGEADAGAALRKATDLQPRLPDAQYRLGMSLEAMGHRREAAIRYRNVLSSGPEARLRRLAEARALLMEGKDDEAEAKLRRAVEIEPNDAASLALLGELRTDAGAFEEATKLFERALGQAQCSYDVYYDLVRSRKITAEDAGLVKRLRSAAAEPRSSDVTRVKLHIALGKALDDLGQFGEAMQAFDAASDIRARAWPADVATFERRVDAIIRLFSADFIESKRSTGNPDPTPVFVLGMPRSGTTLVEQIISSHPKVHGAGELYFWNRRGELMEAAGMNVGDAFCLEAARDCLGHLRALDGGATRIVDKYPFNFQWAGLIHVALPGCALIHCRRSPIDTALSIHQTFFTGRIAFPTGGEALVRYYRAYERLMAHWRRVLPPDRFLEIDYEDLTADPASHSKRMVAHIGLEWDDRCLRPENNTRRVKTPSRWQVRQPINRSSVERWRRYGPYLGPLAELVPRETRRLAANRAKQRGRVLARPLSKSDADGAMRRSHACFGSVGTSRAQQTHGASVASHRIGRTTPRVGPIGRVERASGRPGGGRRRRMVKLAPSRLLGAAGRVIPPRPNCGVIRRARDARPRPSEQGLIIVTRRSGFAALFLVIGLVTGVSATPAEAVCRAARRSPQRSGGLIQDQYREGRLHGRPF